MTDMVAAVDEVMSERVSKEWDKAACHSMPYMTLSPDQCLPNRMPRQDYFLG